MHRFVDLADAAGGIALIADGLPEYEIQDRAVLLTLLRSVGWLSRPDLSTRPGDAGPSLPTPEGQCQRAIQCRYALMPHAGDWLQAGVDRQALLHAMAPAAQRGDVLLGPDPRHFDDPALTASIVFTPSQCRHPLPGRVAFVTLDQPGVELAALKPAERGTGVVVRLASAAGRDLNGLRLQTHLGAQRAWLVDLAEREQRELPLDGGAVELDLPHGSLRSVLFR